MNMPDHSLSITKESKPMSLEVQRATLRERLQRRFEVWLDEALNPEAVPQGLAKDILDQLDAEFTDDMAVPNADEDLQSLCAALIGLTETARHQGGTLEQLHQELPAVQVLADKVSILLDSLAVDRKKQEEQRQANARQEVFKEYLGVVIDLRDYLGTGLDQSQTQLTELIRNQMNTKPKWWQKFTKPKPSQDVTRAKAGLESTIKSCQLTLTRIEQALTQWQITLIEGVGDPVDLETMKVVDQISSDKPQGTVLKVLKAGYAYNGTICRQAEVCVAESDAQQSIAEV